MYLPRTILILLALAALVIATTGTATAGAILAYYPFDSETSGVTPDEMSDNDLTLGGPASIDSASMFGTGAIKSTDVAGYAELADGDPDFDTDYTQLSVSLWADQDGGWTSTSFGGRHLTGKYSTGDNRGWTISIDGGAINQISFIGYETHFVASNNIGVQTAMTSALADDMFHHIVATFDANGTTWDEQFNIYVDGIRQTGLTASTKSGAPATALTKVTGDNSNDFQVLNRGATATSPTSGGGFVGSIDDYVIATGNVLTDQEVALIHGLGRLAGVSYGSGTSVGAELAEVLGAYQTQGSTMAGGEMWAYNVNVGTGPIGMIGGSVAGGDAFIILGADGSGVSVVPEPGTLSLLCAGLVGLLAFVWHKRV